jgi:hypothetical protein
MRRLFVVLAFVTVGIVAVAAPASAEPNTGHLNREVSGPYTGRQSFDFTTPGCSFVQQVFNASYQTDQGRGAFHIDTCVTIQGSGFVYAGTFSLTTPHGATLTGTVTGTTTAVPTSSLHLTLTLHKGTREFKHVTGEIVLSGVWSNDTGVLGHGPTSGTLNGKLSPSEPQGNIFATTFTRCTTLHVGYNRFINGTIVHWTITTNGVGTVDSGQFPAIGGGKLGSKTYHFLSIPLTTALHPEPVQSHAHFTWAIGTTTTHYDVTRDPGC